MRRLKVLMSAYACEPGRGSEPGVGWVVASEMARYHDVWVITRPNHRPFIEAELARNPQPDLHFVYWDLPVGCHGSPEKVRAWIASGGMAAEQASLFEEEAS